MTDYAYNPEKNHFPVMIQLAVLGGLMLLIFGSFLIDTLGANNLPKPSLEPLPTATNTAEIDSGEAVSEIPPQTLRAEAVYVWDIANQRALYSYNESEALPLASITKLMTSVLAYELLTETETTAIPVNAIRQEGSSGLAPGERLSLEKLSQMALISSSNDAAYALSASVGAYLGDDNANDQFVTGMNIRALELGLGSMQFYNPTGLDISTTKAGAYGSARDVSFLMEYIVRTYPELVAPTTKPTARVYNSSGAYHDLENTNPIVTQIPNLLGSKTGYTDLAGGNLTVAFDAGLNRPIVITVLGSTYQERFSDVLTLVEAVQQSVSGS